MSKRLTFLVLPLLFMASGCEQKINIKEVCSNTPELCSDLNTDDGWCKEERTNVIRSRKEQTNPEIDTDLAKYHLLRDFKSYKTCIERAAQVEPIIYKDKKTGRVNALITAENEIQRLEQETINSNEPHLAYYHWRVHGNQEAKARFMAIEDSPALDEPELALAMASYYFERDPDKTAKLLYRAISNYKGELPPESIYDSLTTLNLQEKRYPETYIWMQVAKQLGKKNVSLQTLERYQVFSEEEKQKLDTLAKELAEKITDGTFVPKDASFTF
ncbi:DUF2989 domain-containing protein [Motilimonas sp. KMU-193]|uniref:DUF2989 domain-containing protein n=1 Tax=Motilimonas sp. KMU-193 TaxID=3388668 RepID=UPI00396B4821